MLRHAFASALVIVAPAAADAKKLYLECWHNQLSFHEFVEIDSEAQRATYAGVFTYPQISFTDSQIEFGHRYPEWSIIWRINRLDGSMSKESRGGRTAEEVFNTYACRAVGPRF